MIDSVQFNRLHDAFPILRFEMEQRAAEFQQATYFVCLPAAKVIFSEGDHAGALALIVSGSVRVYKIGKTGREITLYRFGAGDSCILTANAILRQQPFPANAIVEQPVEAVMIPKNIFQNWVQRYTLWRDFVFELLSQRLTDVLALVDDIVFRRMDARTATILLDRCQVQNPITVTHQEIASELGSSREVVSRILEGFVSKGMIRSGRGVIEILDLDSISSFSDM